MSSLSITIPLIPINIVNVGHVAANLPNLLTPDPKEAAVSTAVANGDAVGFGFDMGAPVSLDTFMLGFTNLDASVSYNMVVVACPDATYVSSDIKSNNYGCPSQVAGDRIHFYSRITPATSRYWAIVLYNNSGAPRDIVVGVLGVGLSVAPSWGHEMGAGRSIEDMSNVDRTFGGGFEIDAGAIVGGYSWTFGDLSKTEIAQLYAVARACGNSRTILVVEDVNEAPLPNESIHWSLFDKLDFYERNSPINWKWALKIRDWG